MPKYADLAKGFARSLTADVMGGFGDTANNLENLARAGYGYVGSKLGMLSPSQLPELREPKDAILTSDWLAKNTPLEDTGSGEYTTGRLASLALPLLGGFAARTNAPPPASADQLGAIVFHGSPHKFDRFDSSKIGTGEGAQAYGHGLYLAESPQVAQGYQRDISRAQMAAGKTEAGDMIAGKPIEVFYEQLQRKADRLPPALAGVEYEKLAFLEDLMQQPSFSDAVKRIDNEAIVPWAKALESKYQPAGSFYKVDLPDEAIAKMLNWDKPLSQQTGALGGLLSDVENVGKVSADKIRNLASSPGLADWAKRDLLQDAAQIENSKSAKHVAGVLKRMQLEYGIYPDGGPFQEKAQDFLSFVKGMQAVPDMNTGGGAVSYLNARYGDKQTAELMRGAGIPGIRYLDGGSRGQGQGTSNYVVFPGNENLLTILERNGLPLSSGFGKPP